MGRFDENTSIMRMRQAATLIELRKPELEPQSRARGIANGVLLGVLMWAAIVSFAISGWWKFFD